MTTRRALLAAIGAGLVAPRLALAQAAKQARVTVLFAGDAEDDEPATRAFFDEMPARDFPRQNVSGSGEIAQQ